MLQSRSLLFKIGDRGFHSNRLGYIEVVPTVFTGFSVSSGGSHDQEEGSDVTHKVYSVAKLRYKKVVLQAMCGTTRRCGI